MAVIATWNGMTFEVSANRVYSFEKITMGVDLETKTKKSGKQQYKAKKLTKPRTLTLDITLHRLLGVDVEAECEKWLTLARKDEKAAFFISGRKLGLCKFMLTSAKVTEARVGVDGHFTHAKLTLAWEQASKNTSASLLSIENIQSIMRVAKAQSKAQRAL